MKHRFFLLGSLLLVAIVLAACGASSMPGMNMGVSPMPSSQSTTPTKGTMIITVQVTETEFKIDSSMTSFTTGTAYHFVVKNEGSTAHEFMIMPKSEGSMEGMPMEDILVHQSPTCSDDQHALSARENVSSALHGTPLPSFWL